MDEENKTITKPKRTLKANTDKPESTVKSKAAKAAPAKAKSTKTAVKKTTAKSTSAATKTSTTPKAKSDKTKSEKPSVSKGAKMPSPATKLEKIETYPWLHSYPKDVNWDTPITPKPLFELLQETAKKIPDNNCIDFLGKKFTYRQMASLVDRATKGLQAIGVKKGTRVGLFMPNAHYYVVMYFAIIQAGGIVVNFNPLYTHDEVTHQINDSATEIMVTLDLDLFYQKLKPMLETTCLKKLVICSVSKALPFFKALLFSLIRVKDRAHVQYNNQIISYDVLMANDGKYIPVPINPTEDVALFQYTGGTTGVPKGAMLTHSNVYSNAIQASLWFADTTFGKEKILAALPLFHVFAMTAVMTLAIKTGAEIIMMFPRFSVHEAMDLINKHKITFFPAVPTIYAMINNHPEVNDFNLSSLKMCLSGGAPLPLKIKEDFESLTGCHLVEAYGLSETSPAATSNPMYGLSKQNSIGVPFPQTVVRVVSLENPNEEVPLGEKGQIAIKGPQVMQGYWNHPEETKKSFADGFFLTGDIGYMDADGYTFLVDRIKDVIICSGFNVYPRVVEEAIYKHPAIEEVTVIGVHDEKRGETVKAFVKLKADQVLTADALSTFLHDKLSPIEIPKYIEFRDTLPKTMIGKLSKKELKAEEKEKKSA